MPVQPREQGGAILMYPPKIQTAGPFLVKQSCCERRNIKKSSPYFMGRIIITKKSPERNEAGSGQGINKPWHVGQHHPDRAAGFPEGITKRILPVPEPRQ